MLSLLLRAKCSNDMLNLHYKSDDTKCPLHRDVPVQNIYHPQGTSSVIFNRYESNEVVHKCQHMEAPCSN